MSIQKDLKNQSPREYKEIWYVETQRRSLVRPYFKEDTFFGFLKSFLIIVLYQYTLYWQLDK